MTKKFTIALEGIEWVHGTVGLFMFILQEATQSLGMSCFLASRHNHLDIAKRNAEYGIREICDPAIDFCDTFGVAAYPLHMAYREFFLASRKNFETYLSL